MAVVSSTTAWHQSARVAATVRSPFIASQRLDAAAPLPDLVTRLNQIRPDVLVAYASMIRALAEEQLAGRLRITLRGVNPSSEVLTAEARALASQAWHVPPFNVYAATETGGIAAECHQHHGMHLFEDLVIPEVVDDRYRPVPPGQTGDRLLVTVLSSRTLPLIRYEMTDRVGLAVDPRPCGLPFALLDSIEGRTDDALACPPRTAVRSGCTRSSSTRSSTCSTPPAGRYASRKTGWPCWWPAPGPASTPPRPKPPYRPRSPPPARTHPPCASGSWTPSPPAPPANAPWSSPSRTRRAASNRESVRRTSVMRVLAGRRALCLPRLNTNPGRRRGKRDGR